MARGKVYGMYWRSPHIELKKKGLVKEQKADMVEITDILKQRKVGGGHL